jgi:hypothetical protein
MAGAFILFWTWQEMFPAGHHIFIDLLGRAYQSDCTLLKIAQCAAGVDFPSISGRFWPGGRIVSSAGFPNPHLLGVLLPGSLATACEVIPEEFHVQPPFLLVKHGQTTLSYALLCPRTCSALTRRLSTQ